MPHSTWDLNSLTKDQIRTLCTGSAVLTTGPPVNKSRSVVSILCNPMDYTVHGILQARILEWVAFPFSRRSSQPKDQIQVSRIADRFFTN